MIEYDCVAAYLVYNRREQSVSCGGGARLIGAHFVPVGQQGRCQSRRVRPGANEGLTAEQEERHNRSHRHGWARRSFAR